MSAGDYGRLICVVVVIAVLLSPIRGNRNNPLAMRVRHTWHTLISCLKNVGNYYWCVTFVDNICSEHSRITMNPISA